jgi:glycine/D-amino acid oxidase-like deaminating enzyme
LEASRVGSGQTKGTTAKITAQHGLIYGKLIRDFGEEKARQYAQANREAVLEFRRIIDERRIDCSFEEQPAYLYSALDAEPLREEAGWASKLGLDAVFTTDTELPFPVRGAVRFDGQAQFHPLHFLKALSEPLQVYERTKVTRVEGNKAYTEGAAVTAKHIVFATHYPFVNAPGYYFLRMHQARSSLLALEGAPNFPA